MNRPRRRLIWFSAAALAHAALLAWLNLQMPPPAYVPEGQGVTVGLYDGSVLGGEARELQAPTTELTAVQPEALTAEAAPAPERLVIPELVEPLYLTDASPVDFTSDPQEVGPAVEASAALATAAPAGGGESCGLDARLRGVLQADAEVRMAVASIPRQQRSVSNAVMLWNGRWMDLGASSGPIREAIRDFVLAAPERCREEAVSGPTLFSIESSSKPTILVLGSGLWRWSDLLGPNEAVRRP